jgi:UTP:GlnB (protein PII) uridylyltransferase|tara:strand:+ start:39172 stop:39357 length:186 start_codon:yes stop_codon:yes gene_type:complete
MSDNLWNKDRKKLFRELYHQYMEEGYESKEAKRLAKEEAEEMMAEYEDFAMSVAYEEFGDD